jgi:glycosyltransferase involved in cell wall biosynthesis
MSWLSSGSSHARLIAEFDRTHSEGEVVAATTDSLDERTKSLVQHVVRASPDILIVPALGDPIELNAIRFIPETIPRILILHNSSLATYRGARAVRGHTSATVAISPRIEQDLISCYGFQRDRLKFIPHGIDSTSFCNRPLRRPVSGRIRILSHGRIAKDKGVHWLPEIFSQLALKSNEWECTISGDGPELVDLRRRVESLGLVDRVRFIGWTKSELVPELIYQHDIFLFPSEFEGYPIALIEAMAGGCAPVASRLPGITDWVIEEGINGLNFPVGDTRSAVGLLLELLTDSNRLMALRQHAQESVRKYTVDWMADQYYQLFCKVRHNPSQLRPAERMEHCDLASGLKPAWWYRFPNPIKDRLRLARERIRSSVSVP